MALRDITELMNVYRECARYLWTGYFSRRPNVGASLDAFERIRRILFESLVEDELICDMRAQSDEVPSPVLRVVPWSKSQILIEQIDAPGEASRWGQGGDILVGPDDITLEFLDYFDFYQVEYMDCHYYRCKIRQFSRHAEHEGKDALIEVMMARVYQVLCVPGPDVGLKPD